MENITSKGLYLKNTSGSISISGDITGDNEVHSVSGKVSVKLKGNLNDYRKQFSMTSGSLYIDGQKIKGYTELSQNNFPHSIKISTVSGSIHVDFSQSIAL